MNVQDAAEGVQRAASAAHQGGVVVAVGGGASIPVTQWLGLSVTEWQVVGILGGLLIAFVGMTVNAGINVYFGRKRLEIERASHEIR